MANVPLLDEVIAAHGGAERWARAHKLRIKVRIGGNILALRVKSPRTRTLEVIVMRGASISRSIHFHDAA